MKTWETRHTGEHVPRRQRTADPGEAPIHRREDRYPDATAFRPERFLGADAPDTYTWLPFGGGTRRCLGASFATFEMQVVIRRVLERSVLTPAGRHPGFGVPVALTRNRPTPLTVDPLAPRP